MSPDPFFPAPPLSLRMRIGNVSGAETVSTVYSVVSLLLFPPQKAVIESASISTGEVLLVSMRK